MYGSTMGASFRASTWSITSWNAWRICDSSGRPSSVEALKIKPWLRSMPSSALVEAETDTRRSLRPVFSRVPSLLTMNRFSAVALSVTCEEWMSG